MAELLSQEADRGDELEAKVARSDRSDKAAARWERKYSALKEGVDALVQSVKLERDRARQEQAVLNSLIEEHTVLKIELEAAQEDAKLNLRKSIRLQHELSAALEAGHVDRVQTAGRDCGALSGADEDKREEEEEDDDNDDDEDEEDEDCDGDDSDDSAERLRGELLAFAGEPSSPESRTPVTGEAPHRPPSQSSERDDAAYARSSVGASATDGGGDDEGTFEDASVFVPPPVAGTQTKSAAADPRAPGASNPGSL